MHQLFSKTLVLVTICHNLPYVHPKNAEKYICMINRPNIELDPDEGDQNSMTENIAWEIVEKYYPTEDVEGIEIEQSGLDIEDVVPLFNDYVKENPMTISFREYYALSNFQGEGYRFFYKDSQTFKPHQAFEMANALISLGERFCNNHFGYDDAHEISPAHQKTNCPIDKPSLWRGEIRERSVFDDFMANEKYKNDDRFTSFSKDKNVALDFTRSLQQPMVDPVPVLYELVAAKRFFYLDLGSMNFNMDHEKEVVIFPYMEFRVIDYGMKEDPETIQQYAHVRMSNEKEITYEAWRRSNDNILAYYYEKAQEMRPFETKAAKPKKRTLKSPYIVEQDVV